MAWLAAILLVLLQFCANTFAADFGNIQNTKCRRTIDLTDQFARHVIGVGFKNKDKEPATAYYLAFPKSQISHLSSLEVSNHQEVYYKVQPVSGIQGET
jgi:hypothetical protein